MIKNKIVKNADKIWNVLNDKREIYIKELKKAAKLNYKDLNLALDWLSKENKVLLWGDEKDYNICLSEI